MPSDDRETRASAIQAINDRAAAKKQQAKDKARNKKREIQRDKLNLDKERVGATFPKTAEIAKEQIGLEQELIDVNRELASLMRMLELERRQKIADLGTSYVPAFEGIVQAVYRGIDASGNHYASYGGKAYKVISMGATSIRKGTLVQLWFSGNSYYIDW